MLATTYKYVHIFIDTSFNVQKSLYYTYYTGVLFFLHMHTQLLPQKNITLKTWTLFL